MCAKCKQLFSFFYADGEELKVLGVGRENEKTWKNWFLYLFQEPPARGVECHGLSVVVWCY